MPPLSPMILFLVAFAVLALLLNTVRVMGRRRALRLRAVQRIERERDPDADTP